MKSSINTLVDFKTAELNKTINISCPQEYIDRKMKHLSRKYKKMIPVSEVAKGDVVILTLSGNTEKFNKSHIPVTVGSGLFSRELENQLIGRSAGSKFTAEVDGNKVAVEIDKATRTIFPEPTDDMVKEAVQSMDSMEGIETVQQYRQKIISDYIQEAESNATFDTMEILIDYVLTHSDWEFDENELNEIYHMLLDDILLSVEETFHKSIDEVTPEELNEFMDCSTKDELYALLKTEAEREIATSLFLAASHGIAPASITFEKAEELDWDFLINYIKEQITFVEE